MKFSDIRETEWPALQPYLDTCLLPVTGLAGDEEPWQAADKLEKLRDLLDLIEIPFNGRVVTYPAYHYSDEETAERSLTAVCTGLKRAGFRYIIFAFRGSGPSFLRERIVPGCDLFVTEETNPDTVHGQVAAMWRKSPNNP